MKKIVWILIGGITLILFSAIGAMPRYLEELRIGGGYGEAADGGADFESDGTITTDGPLTAHGDAAFGDTDASHTIRLDAGASDTARIDLNAGDALHGGTLRYDGATGAFTFGTRDNTATPTNFLEAEAGSTNTKLLGNLTVAGGTVSSDSVMLSLESVNGNTLRLNQNQLWAKNNSGALWLVNDSSPPANANFQARLKDANGNYHGYAGIWFINSDDTDGSEDGLIRFGVMDEGTFDYEVASIDGDGTLTADGGVVANGGIVQAGSDSGQRGGLVALEGTGGDEPGYLQLASPDGSVWYLFVEDDGTVRVASSVPSANGDGDIVGQQF